MLCQWQSSLHENVVFSVSARTCIAAYVIFIMWNSISGLDTWYHFRFNISCGVAVKVRSHQEKFQVIILRGGEGGRTILLEGRVNVQSRLHFLGHLYFWRRLHFGGCLHFWGHLYFWRRLHFLGCLHIWGRLHFLVHLYFWGRLPFEAVFIFKAICIFDFIFIFEGEIVLNKL